MIADSTRMIYLKLCAHAQHLGFRILNECAEGDTELLDQYEQTCELAEAALIECQREAAISATVN